MYSIEVPDQAGGVVDSGIRDMVKPRVDLAQMNVDQAGRITQSSVSRERDLPNQLNQTNNTPMISLELLHLA
jgi:hypothetical protein